MHKTTKNNNGGRVVKPTLISTILLGASLNLATGAYAQPLGIGAGTQGSQNYTMNTSFAKLLNSELGLNVRVQAYGGSGQSLPLIDMGRLDFQLFPSPDVLAAEKGEDPFVGKAMKNLRVVASMGSTAYGLMVRKDSTYHNVSEIKGLSITYGYSAQPTLRAQVDGLLAAGGLSIDDMVTDNVPSVPNGADDFINGSAAVAFFAVQGGKTREADANVGIRWLAINDTPEAEDAMKHFVPTSYAMEIFPRGNVGVAKATPTMGYDYVLTTGADVPDELVSKIVKFIHDNPDEIRAASRSFANFDPNAMAPASKG